MKKGCHSSTSMGALEGLQGRKPQGRQIDGGRDPIGYVPCKSLYTGFILERAGTGIGLDQVLNSRVFVFV